MKKIVFALAALAIFSCKENKPVDYTLITGKISNNSENLKIYKGRELKKEITLSEIGEFSDTLRLETGDYSALINNQVTKIYVKNGNHFNLTANANEFNNTLAYTGQGAKANQTLLKLTNLQQNLDYVTLISKNKNEFDKGLATFKNEYSNTIKEGSNSLDSATIAIQNQDIEEMAKQLTRMFNAESKMKAFNGKAAPIFKNYENYKGGKTSLTDLKGKYVYIDLWATWCGPCKKEIPFLKEVEAKYHGKNIEFVSISLDNGRGYKAESKEAAFAASNVGWKKMVAEKELTGIQLFADNGFNSTFAKELSVNSIPRFILIDTNGNIINANAPRPSSPKLIELLNKQNI